MERRRSIFDSKPEKHVFRSLTSTWGKDYLISDHVPVRNVLGWDQIRSLALPDGDTRFLLSADFDFVVCTKEDGYPLLAVEFDGYSRGFSKDGQFLSSLARDDRRRKFNIKLEACERFEMPIVIVSYEEAFSSARDRLTILDAIVGSVISGQRTAEEVNARMDELSSAYEDDPGGEFTAAMLDYIRISNDLKYNPVVGRTEELRKAIGYTAEGVQFLHDRDRLGYVGGRFAITSGIEVSGNGVRMREHFAFDLYLRAINCGGCDAANLLYEMGHYLLLVKAMYRFGTGEQFWLNAEKRAHWVER